MQTETFKSHYILLNLDDHNKLETPVPISNTEVKQFMLWVVLALNGKPTSRLLLKS